MIWNKMNTETKLTLLTRCHMKYNQHDILNIGLIYSFFVLPKKLSKNFWDIEQYITYVAGSNRFLRLDQSPEKNRHFGGQWVVCRRALATTFGMVTALITSSFCNSEIIEEKTQSQSTYYYNQSTLTSSIDHRLIKFQPTTEVRLIDLLLNENTNIQKYHYRSEN